MALRYLVEKSAIRASKVEPKGAPASNIKVLLDQVYKSSSKSDGPAMYGMMYSPDKMMMNSKPLGPTITGTNCFSGRYSPTYRVPDQMRDPMRRCMTNPPVSHFYFY
jgi:hypothetical protein